MKSAGRSLAISFLFLALTVTVQYNYNSSQGQGCMAKCEAATDSFSGHPSMPEVGLPAHGAV